MSEDNKATIRVGTCIIQLLYIVVVLAFPQQICAGGVKDVDRTRCARVGTHAEVITEALLEAKPQWRSRLIVDDLNVTALYAECAGKAVCLLSYDICEIMRHEVPPLQKAVAGALAIQPECVHIFCSHTHSSSTSDTEHDSAILTSKSISAAVQAMNRAVEVKSVDFVRVDTDKKFNINRRTVHGELGTWCLMQSRGCLDDGRIVDGTQWVRDKLLAYGAKPEDISKITSPIAADRENDPYLDLILFPKSDGGYAGGLVRFTAHAVICSAGYFKPNLGRDYPGQLCDRLSKEFKCPIAFLQGPCGDHRPRHRQVGIAERDRIGLGLAELLIARIDKASRFPFDRLEHTSQTIQCPLRKVVPASPKEANRLARRTKQRLEKLSHGRRSLKQRKDLAELAAFYRNAERALDGSLYLTKKEADSRRASLTVSHIAFGKVHMLNFPGELFSTVTKGLENAVDGPVVVSSFADGVTGYLIPREDLTEGGYESTWALFTPESISQLRTVATDLIRRHR